MAEGDDTIDAIQLGRILRSFGQNPTEDELKVMNSEVDPENKGTIRFKEFYDMLVKRMRDIDEEEETRDAFDVFDEDKDGHISKADLRHVMTSLGRHPLWSSAGPCSPASHDL
jgi:calmodulin